MSILTRIARLAAAMALAVAGVAMVSHHIGSDSHVVTVHEHPAAATSEAPVGEPHHHGLESEHEHEHGHDHSLLLMGCAALVVALLASLRYAPPAPGLVESLPVDAPRTVTPHSSAEPAPPPLDQLCVLRR